MVHSKVEITYTHNYYDNRGWEYTNPGWYELVLYPETDTLHLEMVKWMYDNLDNPEKHARWMFQITDMYYSYFKFRYEREYIWFKLRWG